MNIRILLLILIFFSVMVLFAPLGLIIFFIIISYYVITSLRNFITNFYIGENKSLIDAKIIVIALVSVITLILIDNYVEFQYTRRFVYFYEVLLALYYIFVAFYYSYYKKINSVVKSTLYHNIVKLLTIDLVRDSEENLTRLNNFLLTLIFFLSLFVYIMYFDLGFSQN
ncbi:MAG: hypothetical protein PF638_15975 [Candidatus Delongbacteria bacterium]|jgi:hypothetical protein|nr:hypothetical protein [Candidatus Delongbacteria bacterium]